MRHYPSIAALAVLAVLSVALDIVGGLLAPGLRSDYTLLLFGGRLLLDVTIVASFFLRRRAVWVTLTALYGLGIFWRTLVLVPGLLGMIHLPASNRMVWLLASHLAIAIGSVVLLSQRQTKNYFENAPSA